MRARYQVIGICFALVILACSLGAPSTPVVAPVEQTPVSLATVRPDASPVFASPSPDGGSTPLATATPERAPRLVISPEHAGQIGLLASLQGSATGRLNNVTWHPAGKTLLVEGSNSLFLLDAQSWQTLWSIPRSYARLVFTPDGSQILGLDGAGQAQRLDAATGELLSSSQVLTAGRFAITPDGRFVADTLGGDISLLDWDTGQVTKSLPSDLNSGAIYDMAFSADGKWALAGSDNGDLQAWDLETGQRTLMRPAVIPSPVYQCDVRGAMAGAPTGSLLVVCSYPFDNYQGTYYQVGIFPASANAAGAGTVIKDVEGRGYASFTVNADRTRLAVAAGDSIEIWSAAGGSRIRTLAGAPGGQMVFNPAEKRLLAVWSERVIQIWDVNSGEKVSEWATAGPDSPALRLAFSPNPSSRLLAVGREDGSVQLWDPSSGQKTASWQAEELKNPAGLVFSPDGALLVASGKSGSIFVFDAVHLAPDFTPKREFNAGFPISAIAFSSDARQLYVIGDSIAVNVWDVGTGSQTAEWKAGSEYLRTLAVRGDTLAVGSSYGIISTWSAPGGQPPDTFRMNNLSGTPVLQISPDQTQLLVMKGFAIQVWEIATPRKIRDWQAEHTPSLAYSPDGCTLAVGEGFSLQLMDVSQATYYKTVGEQVNILDLAFRADGAVLAVGYANGEVHLWGLDGALEADAGPVPALRCGSFSPAPTPSPTPTASLAPYRTPTFTPSPPVFTRTLYLAEPFMRGEDVFLVQQRLLELGYSEAGAPDGVFGKQTDAAIRRFQEKNGLEADGYVGPRTWQALFSQSAVPNS